MLGSAVLQLITLAVLGRLLSPEVFGLYASCGILMSFATMFAEAGVGPALVHKQEIDRRHLCGGFYLSLILGGVVCGLIYILAPFYALLFDTSEVIEIARVMSLTFLIASFGVVSKASLERRLAFKQMSCVEMLRAIVQSATAILMACWGYGVWAIIYGAIAGQVIYQLSMVLMAPPVLKQAFQWRDMIPIIKYGSGLTASRFSNQVAQNADYFVIGKFLGVGALGFYERAFKVMQMPAGMLGNVLDRVGFPIMTTIQNDNEKLTSGFFQGLKIGYLLQIPFCIFVSVHAEQIVYLLLGSGWDAAVFPLRVLVLTLPFRILARLGDSLCRAKGAVHPMAKRKFLFAILVIGFSMVGVRWGVAGVAVGVTCAVLSNYFMVASLCHKVLELDDGLKRQLKAVVMGGVMGSVVLVVSVPLMLAWKYYAFGNLIILSLNSLVLVGGISLLLVKFKQKQYSIFDEL